MTAPIADALGRPIHDLRISVTDRCNFRCTYCMPAEVYGERYHFLPQKAILSYEETARLTQLFVDLGVTKVRLTGASRWCGGTSIRWWRCSRASPASRI